MRRRIHRVPGRALPGQTLVLFALAQLVLLGALGLAIDGGYLFMKRRAMQNAADAAALAGATAISQDKTDSVVLSTVLAAAERNGVDPSQVTCRFFTNSYPGGTIQDCTATNTAMSGLLYDFTGVEVRVAERHTTFVLRAVGTPEAGTSATAAAQVQVAANFRVGPFVVCAIDTAIASAPPAYSGGGIYETQSGYVFADSGPPNYVRVDTYDNCEGFTCKRTVVDPLTGGPKFNEAAWGFDNANLDPVLQNNGVKAYGPSFLIHDSNGITVCNDNSSSFKGINTNTPVVSIPEPGYWPEYLNPPTSGASAPVITTGNITSVQATVEGANGCVAGGAFDNCILILPVVDNSGPGGVGSNAAMAWRTLQAFYIEELSNGSHSGALIKNYTIVGDGNAIWVPGSKVITSIHVIK